MGCEAPPPSCRPPPGREQQAVYNLAVSTSFAIIARCPVFAGFTESEQRALAERALIREFAPGARIYADQDQQRSLTVIRSGIVSFSALSQAGKEVVLTLLGPGAWFGNTVFTPGLPRVLHANAHSPTSLLEVPGPLLRELLARNPDAAMAALDSLGRRLWAMLTVFQDDAVHTVPVRLVRRLILLSEFRHYNTVSEGDSITFEISQELLAQVMGMTRQGLRPCLRELQAADLLSLTYGKVTIPSVTALQQFLATQDAALPPGCTTLT